MKTGIVFSLVLLFCSSAALPAFADDHQNARVHFRMGALAYTEGNIEMALAEFQLAFALKPSFKIRYNIAQCLMELGRLDEAYEMYVYYLVEGEDSIDSERLAEVNETLEQIRERLGGEVPEVKVGRGRFDAASFFSGRGSTTEEEYIFDPRAASGELRRRPGDMSKRDWYGVSSDDWVTFEKRRIVQPELVLEGYLIERTAESKALFWVEVASGALAATGVGLAIGGAASDQGGMTISGVTLLLAGGIVLAVELIVDKMDLGQPNLLYPERLEKVREAREAAEE